MKDRQIVVRPVETCEKCGAVQSWRKLGGKYIRGTVTVWTARCAVCGARGQIMQRESIIVTDSVKTAR